MAWFGSLPVARLGSHFRNAIPQALSHHSDELARQHYLRVDEANLAAATHSQIDPVLTQGLTQIAQIHVISQEDDEPQLLRFEDFKDKAGERIRTADVQLGKLAFYH